tara:strand:+ start:7792 stop:8046 length:255 start_codon:yes stop_codon:yes gene_type:complete
MTRHEVGTSSSRWLIFDGCGKELVQGTGFEPAKHYALGPKPSPFDRSGTPAVDWPSHALYFTMPRGLAANDPLTIDCLENNGRR